MSGIDMGFMPYTMSHMHRMRHSVCKPKPRKPLPKGIKRSLKQSLSHILFQLGCRIPADDVSSYMLGWNVQKGRYHEDIIDISSAILSKRFCSMGLPGSCTIYYGFYDRPIRETVYVSCSVHTENTDNESIVYR